MRRWISGIVVALALGAPLCAMTQEEYQAMADQAYGLYDAGNWAAAADKLAEFARMAEGAFGPQHPEVLYIRSLQVLALEWQQRWPEVEALASAVLATGSADPQAERSLLALAGSLGRAHYVSGQEERAFATADAALARAIPVLGDTHPSVVAVTIDRARAAAGVGTDADLRQAAADYARVAEVTAASGDPGARGYTASALREGAWIADRQGDLARAADLLGQAIPLFEAVYGPNHIDTLNVMLERVAALMDMPDQDINRFAEALALSNLLHERAEATFGKGSAIAAEALAQSGYLMLLNPLVPGMQEASLQIMDIAVQDMARSLPADNARLANWQARLASVINASPAISPEWARRAVDLTRSAMLQKRAGMAHVSQALQRAETYGAMTNAEAAEQALLAVQELQFGMAPAVMGFWQKRLEQDAGPARDLHRAFTDTTLTDHRLEDELMALLQVPLASRDAAQISAVQAALAESRSESDRLAAELARLDPTFGANFAGVTLGLADLRALLDPDEAAVVIAMPDARVNDSVGLIVAVSDEAIAWAPLDRPSGENLDSVAALRDAMQVRLGVRSAEALGSDGAGAKPLRTEFSADTAYRLYEDTLGKVAQVTADKAHLYLDLRGAMSALPPQLLVVTAPVGEDLAGADWLIRHHAVTVIPSLTSLRTLDLARAGGAAPDPFLAYGDPVYGAAADDVLASLRGGLAPLPETAGEVREVALALGAGQDALRLGGQASEAQVKSEDLSRFRVLHFATHGLVSGDAVGPDVLGEPALALTPGQGEDGFLKASEILNLRLNADMVVLSACNTALGSGGDAEALSGLAQAFLYAGARSLLVSHWPVESRSAAHLMTETFRIRAETPGMRVAEAQRRAMLAMADGDPRWAHPAYWAPFVVVGSPD